MRSSISLRKVHGLAVLLVCAVAGCDGLPSLPAPPAASLNSDVVSDQGRGGYNWRLNGLQFETQPPTSFTFVDQLRPDVIRRNLEVPDFVERSAPHKPEGMDDDVYSWFRRFTEAPTGVRQLMEVEQSDDVGVNCGCINFEGTRILTVAKKLIQWDVHTGQRLKQFDAPIEKCIGVAYDRTGQSAVLQNAQKLVRVSLEDGRILHEWQPPQGKIETFVSARDVDAQAVLMAENQLLALADNFAQVSTYRNKKLASKKLAIHPKGLWILGLTDNAMMRWRLDSADKPAEFMPTLALNVEDCVPTSGTLTDRWADPIFVHEFVGMQERLIEPGRFPCIFLNSFVLAAANATVDGTQDWMVIVGEKYDAQGRATRFVQDLHFDMFDYSVPAPLPEMEFQKYFFDATGEHLAFVVGDKLRVFERSRWADANGRMTAERVGALLAQGRIGQLELCARELRAEPVLRNGRRGEDIYGTIALYASGYLSHLEENPASPEIMEKIDEWYQSGSELALLVSGQRHLNVGINARGTGYANTVTPEGWAALAQRSRTAYDDLMRIPNRDEPSACTLLNLVILAKNVDLQYEDAEKWLTQAAELYPYDPTPIGAMCNWLLPRWGGTRGEAGALLAAVAARYPAPESEFLYARTVVNLTVTLNDQAMQYEAGFSVLRVLDAIEPLLKQGNPTRYEVEVLLEIARNAQKRELVKKLAEYHAQHFGMPSEVAYHRAVALEIAQAKEEGLAKSKEVKR